MVGGSSRIRRGTAAAIGSLTAIAFGLRFAVLLRTDEPTGTDGYYYVVQATDLAATGIPHVPDASWVLRWLALPHALGVDAIVAVKLAAAALAAATVPAAWLLGRRLATGGGVALALWAAASPTLTHLAADFPKNLGLVPALFVALALAPTGPGVSRRRAVAWGAAIVATATAHRLGAALVALAAFGAVLGIGARRIRPGYLAAGVVGLVTFALITPWVPGLLHPADLDRITGQLRSSPWPPPPWSWLPLRRTHPVQILELGILPWAGGFAGLWALADRDRRPMAAAALLPLGVCLWPNWRADGLDLGYRLGLMAPVLAAPLIVSVVRWRPWTTAIGVLALPAALVGFDPASTPPYARYRELIAAIPRPLPDLLIAHQGINFLYDHITGHEALAWAPEADLDRRRIGRIVHGFRDGEWAAWAPMDPAPVRLDAGYVYVREDVWEAFVARARIAGGDEVTERLDDRRNPTTVRPAAMTRAR